MAVLQPLCAAAHCGTDGISSQAGEDDVKVIAIGAQSRLVKGRGSACKLLHRDTDT